jgi:5'-3' exonuclease
MDCNSIIYDAFRTIENSEKMNVYQLEEELLNKVVDKICDYILYIFPSKTAYIAFDGVAPLAKMDQQRNRRYKNNKPGTTGWSTSNITPGTLFMKKLSSRITNYFKDRTFNNKHGLKCDIIVSTSDEAGEGEHKLFHFIRTSGKISPEDKATVYGLDSDLIMLSIFHAHLFNEIYIFREAPEFMKSSILLENSESGCYFMDIKKLADSILSEMHCGTSVRSRIYDYIFMCFFLGNDFLPHFPSLSLRTSGIHILLEIYRLYIGKFADRTFIDSSLKIQWKWVHLFINELAKRENDYLLQEYTARSKWNKNSWLIGTEEERDNLIQNVPVIYRAEEEYICPKEKGWELRYYKCLFGTEIEIKSICQNYIEGLEWVFKYYTQECPHWRWKYNYHYPPLLKDLCKHISNVNKNYISSIDKKNKPIKSDIQLAYVLPESNHHLITSSAIRDVLKKDYSELYPREFKYQWAFCRYLWEAHVILPEINDEIISKWETAF